MPSVVLIGDSIRLGYQPRVVRLLRGKARVWGPAENCRHSRCLLDNLQAWVLDRRPDAVHLNCGLHDAAEDVFPDRKPQISLSDYARNLAQLVDTLRRQSPRTRIVWALTTPRFLYCYEPRHLPFDRWKAKPNIARYNARARAVMRARGIAVNDLHAAILKNGAARCIQSLDGLHMTEFGNEVLARAVAGAVAACLSAPSAAR